MSKAWLWVLFGGMFETVWATFMKMSDGFTVIHFTILTLIFMFVSVWMLNKGLKLGLPMGPSYAVWVGIGAIGAVIVGIALFGEMLNLVGFLFLALVIGGIIGLNLVTKEEDTQEDGKAD